VPHSDIAARGRADLGIKCPDLGEDARPCLHQGLNHSTDRQRCVQLATNAFLGPLSEAANTLAEHNAEGVQNTSDLVFEVAVYLDELANRALYKQDNRIERMFGQLKINRAIATRYDQLAASFMHMVHLTTTRYWLKFVHAA